MLTSHYPPWIPAFAGMTKLPSLSFRARQPAATRNPGVPCFCLHAERRALWASRKDVPLCHCERNKALSSEPVPIRIDILV